MKSLSGVDFDPTSLKVSDIKVTDITHALSQICRFGGHCSRFYSVAEHSLLTAYLAHANQEEQQTICACLIHDMHEAYTGDVPTPLKNVAFMQTKTNLVPWSDMEMRNDFVIREAFNMPRAYSTLLIKNVRFYDEFALNVEIKELMPAMENDPFINILEKHKKQDNGILTNWKIEGFTTPPEILKIRQIFFDMLRREFTALHKLLPQAFSN